MNAKFKIQIIQILLSCIKDSGFMWMVHYLLPICHFSKWHIYKNGLTNVNPGSIFDFQLNFISSIITSGYKWMGMPWPCGIYITKSGLINQLSRTVSVLNVTDAAISVSRNVHSTILLWSHICQNSYDKEVESVLNCLKLALYAIEKLEALEREIGIDLWPVVGHILRAFFGNTFS